MKENIIRKYNIRLYPIYKMFSWDLLFYYAIIYLFLTVEKGLSASLVLVIDAIFQFSKFIFQIPCTVLVDLTGTRKSLIFANISTSLGILFLIFSFNFPLIIISNIFLAIGFNFRQLCESSMLYNSIKKHRKRNFLFSKIDGHGLSYHYYLDAASAVFTGFLFVINSYIPMILCFIFCCISTYLAFKFVELPNTSMENQKFSRRKSERIHKYFKELKHIFKFIVRSKRLKCLLGFSGLFTGFLALIVSLRSMVLIEIDLPEKYFGIALAMIQICAALSSKQTNRYQQLFRNKTLTYFSLCTIFPVILLGLSLKCNLPITFIIFFTIVWFILYAIAKGPFYTLIKRYLHSFVSSEVNTKIYSIQTIIDGLCSTIFALIAAFLIERISLATTLIIIGVVLSISFILLLDYMKSHVGLKAEEYPKSEITYIELK